MLIVDNDSIDGTPSYAEEICSKHKDCRVIRLGDNYGWAGGNNRGAILAKNSDLLLFVNDDVVLGQGCIRRLAEVLYTHRDVAAVQPLIINRDGTINCGLDLALSGLPKMLQKPRNYPLSEAFYVSGAALMTRRDAFFEVGMFDEDFFLYHDDADYSWRLRLAGYRVLCITDARALHYGSATLGPESPSYLYFLTRNNIWTLAKNSSLPWLLLRLVLMLIEVFISFFLHFLFLRRDVRRASAVLKGLKSIKS